MKTKSKTPGSDTSEAEVSHISSHGLWLLVTGKEYFLSFENYPWFAEAKVAEVLSVKLLHGCHLRWENLDVDLELDSLADPTAYPLVYR